MKTSRAIANFLPLLDVAMLLLGCLIVAQTRAVMLSEETRAALDHQTEFRATERILAGGQWLVPLRLDRDAALATIDGRPLDQASASRFVFEEQLDPRKHTLVILYPMDYSAVKESVDHPRLSAWFEGFRIHFVPEPATTAASAPTQP